MKILDKRKWIAVFAALAVFAVIGLTADTLISSLIYRADDTFESIFYKVIPTVPIAMCSLSAAVMLSCRNTRATRSKNRALNILYGFLTLAFAFAAAYYPFFGAKGTSLIAVAVVAAVISVTAFFMSVSLFKETYQKIIVCEIAKRVMISTAAIAAVCALAMLIPQKMSYDAMQLNLARTGRTEGPFSTTVPFVPFATASAPLFTYLTALKDAVPKLRFSGKALFIVTCVWTVIVMGGTVISGRLFLSNAVFGAALGYAAVLLTSKMMDKKEI